MLMTSTVRASWIEARQRLKSFLEKWQNLEAKAVEIFQRDIELTFTFYQFEAELHPRIRTSNLLERLFEEFRRKADEIGAFPHEMSCLTWFFLVVQREHALSQPTLSRSALQLSHFLILK